MPKPGVRTPRRPTVLAVTATVLTALAAVPAMADPADDSRAPSQSEVDRAREVAAGAERSVASVRAELALANDRLHSSAIRAAQASEAYNAARWKLHQAQEDVRRSERRERRAARSVERQRAFYDEAVASTYEIGGDLTALQALVDQDGVDGVSQTMAAADQVFSSIDSVRAEFAAAQEVAEVAGAQAESARAEAAELTEQAEGARAAAQARADQAAAEAAAITRDKDQLLAELARLQGISLELATQRQSALEAAAQQEAAAAHATGDRGGSTEQVSQGGPSGSGESSAPSSPAPSSPDPGSTAPAAPEPAPQPQPQPQPAPAPEPAPAPAPAPEPAPAPDPSPPAPSGGASAAIAFARAQIGEPYAWGAAGPSRWDCSGLTMMAWAQGGGSLPHWSVGQYHASTPIRSSQLRPGDLVFWGSSSSPGSIYHVGLYAGNGRMVHAPRTGRDVEEVSIYYWIPPTHFARP